MKKKAVVWGLGGTTRAFMEKKGVYHHYEVAAFTDNNPAVWHTKFMGIPVIAPSELSSVEYDCVLICSQYYGEIRKQLEETLSVNPAQIASCFELEDILKNRVIEKYSSVQDEEVQEMINYFRHNPLNVFGSYAKTGQRHLVYTDQDKHPYIIFDDKRMYFPDTYMFIEAEGRRFVNDVLYEQGKGSPHRYVREGERIEDGSVIVDAGVCEGNFALRYVEKAERVYLIESDPVWMQALERTFWPYRNKVVFCPKFLSGYDSEGTITLDSLVHEKIDFLKMDIEGAEVDALRGAGRILKESDAKCAICSYHKQRDEENIRSLLEAYGYHTSTSTGFMFFLYDENIGDTLDLRRGVVYGQRDGALHI